MKQCFIFILFTFWTLNNVSATVLPSRVGIRLIRNLKIYIRQEYVSNNLALADFSGVFPWPYAAHTYPAPSIIAETWHNIQVERSKSSADKNDNLPGNIIIVLGKKLST